MSGYSIQQKKSPGYLEDKKNPENSGDKNPETQKKISDLPKIPGIFRKSRWPEIKFNECRFLKLLFSSFQVRFISTSPLFYHFRFILSQAQYFDLYQKSYFENFASIWMQIVPNTSMSCLLHRVNYALSKYDVNALF